MALFGDSVARLYDSSAQDVSAHAPTRCRHVAPVLRTTLLVLTVLLACSAGVLLGKMFFGDTPTERWVHRGIPYTALVAVFLLQLVYLVRVGSDRHGPGRSGGCVGDGMRRGQWWALVAFAVVQLVFGGWLFVEG